MRFGLKINFRQGFTIINRLSSVHSKTLSKVYHMSNMYIYIYMVFKIMYAFCTEHELKTVLYYT